MSSLPVRARATLELRRRRQTGVDPFQQFQRRYYHNPAGLVENCIHWPDGDGPAPYQLNILNELITEKRVAVRSLHGIGKTTVAAWVVLWAILTEDDCKVPTTASAWRQLSHFLWPEIRKWALRIKWNEISRGPFTREELLKLSLSRGPTCEAFACACADAETIEGAHARRIVYVYDESKAVPDETFDATEGAFAGAGEDTKAEAFALAISTPGEPRGRFYDICSHKAGYEDWKPIHVTLADAIAAGRVSREWVEQRAKQWGKTSAVYQNRVLGDFAADDATGIIPLAWIEAAVERWREWDDLGRPGTFTGVGVDVGGGGSGGDKTVLAPCYDYVKIVELRKYARGDPHTATMETVGRVNGLLTKLGGMAMIDVIGIGAGVVHRLCELGKAALAFNAAKRTALTDVSGELGFKNWRAAAWWLTREMLEPGSGFGVCLPPDDELIGDLTAPRAKPVSTGVIQVESKIDIIRRLKRSTDCGDAVVQVLVGPTLCDEEAARGGNSEVVEMPWQSIG